MRSTSSLTTRPDDEEDDDEEDGDDEAEEEGLGPAEGAGDDCCSEGEEDSDGDLCVLGGIRPHGLDDK